MSANSYALLISVGNYENPHIPNLRSSKMDLILMQEALVNGLHIAKDKIRLIGENGKATIANLLYAMKDFSRMLQAEDTFLFYFSGHGSNGELQFSDQGIGLQSVIHYMETLPSKNKILILDCCYAGNFSEMAPKSIELEDSLENFAGRGTAVMASSSANELSRLGPGGNHSLFTGMVCHAFLSKQMICHGKKSLASLIEYVRSLMDSWNAQHPKQSQQPIIRTSLGGTIYFQVEEYHPNQPLSIAYQCKEYKVTAVKPLHNRIEDRLIAFVIPMREDFEEQIPQMTKEIAKYLDKAGIFPYGQERRGFFHRRPKILWCYFGKDQGDLIHSTHYAYSIWTTDSQARNKYYRKNTEATIKDDIYVFKNSSYEMLRAMREDRINQQEYEEEVKKLFYAIIDHAEQYVTCITEVFNKTKSLEEAKKEYLPWADEVYQLYYRLSDIDIAPEEMHDWVENVMQLAGWVIDMTLALQNNKTGEVLEKRNQWIFQNAVKNYYDCMAALT